MRVQEKSLKKIQSNYSSNKDVNKNCNLHIDYKNRLKYRRKRTRRVRPKAPHNTSTFIIESQNSSEEVEKISRNLNKEENFDRMYCIDDFIITGGSMIGIFLNK